MLTDRNELQAYEVLGKRREISISGQAKRWNHWGDRGTFPCHSVDNETDLSFAWFRKGLGYDRQRVDLLSQMFELAHSFMYKPQLDYFVVSPLEVDVGLKDIHT